MHVCVIVLVHQQSYCAGRFDTTKTGLLFKGLNYHWLTGNHFLLCCIFYFSAMLLTLHLGISRAQHHLFTLFPNRDTTAVTVGESDKVTK